MLNQNTLAAIAGISLVLMGSAIAFFFQKRIFTKYRGRVRNAGERDD